MKRFQIAFIAFLLLTVCIIASACNKGTQKIKSDDVSIEISADMKKSVPLPANYPQKDFPIIKDSFIVMAQSADDGLLISFFSKGDLNSVIDFYKKVCDEGHVISESRDDGGFASWGVKGDYTFSFVIIKSDEMKGYQTLTTLILAPEDGMGDFLKDMPSISQQPAIGSQQPPAALLSSFKTSGYGIKEGVSLPAGYPIKTLPIIGGELSFVEAAMESQGQGMVGYMTKLSFDEVLEYYKSHLKGASNLNIIKNGNATVITGNKDGFQISVAIMPNDSTTKLDTSFKTLVQMNYQK